MRVLKNVAKYSNQIFGKNFALQIDESIHISRKAHLRGFVRLERRFNYKQTFSLSRMARKRQEGRY